MAFVREKIIGGKKYYYLVENKKINGKVRQKVLAYIGDKEKLTKLRINIERFIIDK